MIKRPSADHTGAATTLTAQEREIADLAATGLTNKQIGERLFLSHRTVGTHLYRIFPKLGITTRAALRDALAGLLRSRLNGVAAAAGVDRIAQ